MSLVSLPLHEIQPSPSNPRARMDQKALDELTASVIKYGVQSPVLAREIPKGHPKQNPKCRYELVYGHRRLAAAQAAGLSEIPAQVRPLTDQEALEIQLVENRDRADIHPLDEAEAFRRFHWDYKYSVEDIAARVGRPVQYVKDRLRLMLLVPEATDHFLEGRIHLGHAIILARLKPAEQKRAIDAGLFQDENVLFREDEEPEEAEDQPLKVRTVRELQGWVDSHVKLDVKAPVIADLFPETHAAVAQAAEGALKVLPITYEYVIPDDAKDGERVYTTRSWRRADGKSKSKTCDKSVTGIVMVGPGRGESFAVCINKTCTVHYAEEIKAAAARAKHGTGSKAASKATARANNSQSRWELENKLDDLNRKAFQASAPAVTAQLIKLIGKLDVKPTGKLADYLVGSICDRGSKPTTHMARGKDAKAFLKYLLLLALEGEMDGWNSFVEFPKTARKLGFKLEAVLPKRLTKLPTEAKGAKPTADEDEE